MHRQTILVLILLYCRALTATGSVKEEVGRSDLPQRGGEEDGGSWQR